VSINLPGGPKHVTFAASVNDLSLELHPVLPRTTTEKPEALWRQNLLYVAHNSIAQPPTPVVSCIA
jgi:hypothetical protein